MAQSRKTIEARRYRKSRAKRIAAEREYKNSKKGDPVYEQKQKARAKVRTKVRNGTAKKPKQCSKCGKKTTKLQFHHTNYRTNSGSWVCTDCNPKGGAAPVKKR